LFISLNPQKSCELQILAPNLLGIGGADHRKLAFQNRHYLALPKSLFMHTNPTYRLILPNNRKSHIQSILLLIVDELGYVPFMAIGAELLC